MRIFHATTLAVAALWLGACSAPSSQAPGPTNPLSGNNQPGGPPPPPATFHPQFDPLKGLLPYPSDLYLNNSTDGTVNLPMLQIWPNARSVNALDGFSTNGRITATFSAPIDPASITPGSVIVIETRMRTIATPTTVARVPVGFRRMLTPGLDYTASVSTAADAFGQVLEILPLKPLKPSTGGAVVGAPPGFIDEAGGFGYLVILTTGIKSAPAAGGAKAAPDATFAALEAVIGTPPNPANCAAIADPATNGLCRQIAPQLALAAGVTGILPPSIALTFSFTTQATRDTLVQMATAIQANTLAIAQAARFGVQPAPGPGGILNTHDINPALPGLANIYVGTITLPYYLPTPADATAAIPAPPLNGQWLSATPVSLLPGVDCTPVPAPAACTNYVTRYNPTPAKTHDVTIPVLATLPRFVLVNGAPVPAVKPNTGWPVVIFIHGITRSRADMLAIADSYASVGIAVIAIDLPLHGITPTSPAAALRLPGVAERTFDVNYVNNTTLQPPAEPGNDPANVDPSGANFIQIASPITSRDNLREGIIDELTLAAVLPFGVAVGQAAPAFDGNQIQVAGQSLGSIAGITIASLPSSIRSFAMSVPGGGIAQLLIDSATFGPPIGGAVAAQLGPDTLLFRAFFRDAQAAADAGDPINHVAIAVANKSLLIHKVLNDQVIPNSATDRLFLAAGAGLTQMSKAAIGLCPITPPPPFGFGTSTCPGNSYVTFTVGSHGSLLDPTASLAVTSEMQREFVGFAFANGAAFPVFDTTNIQ